MAAKYLTCTEAEYFADPCESPSLNQSLAGILVTKSPAHAWLAHPRLGGGAPREHTKATDLGTVLHKLLLGKGAEIVSIEADDWRTKKAQEQRDQARAEGKAPILAKELAEQETTAANVRGALQVRGIKLVGGRAEVPFQFEEQTRTGDTVICRGMFDYVDDELGRIIDLKSTRNANPAALARSFYDYGYDIQWAAYTRGYAQLRPELEGRGEMVFCFFETEPPYATLCIQPSGPFREIGEHRWEQAVNTFGACLKADLWPDYSYKIIPLHPPAWALSNIGEAEAQQ